MQMARVIGDVVATYKDPAFEGTRLMLVQPIGADAPEITARFRDPAGNILGVYQQPASSG